MPFTCQQCGNVLDQPMNFCRKCGAPALTVTLATMPLGAIGSQATQEIGQIGTDALKTNPPTRQMVEVDLAVDPLDTWEPTKSVAAPAVTEVLSSAPFTPPPAPVAANAPKSMVVTATAAPKSNKGILMAAAAAVLLALAGGGWFLMNRTSTPPSTPPGTPTDMPALAANTPVAETNAGTPLPSPVANVPEAVLTNSPAPNATVTNTKPAASGKVESKVNASALPSPTPNVYGATKSAAPEPEPEKAAPVESSAGNNAAWIEQGNRLASAGKFQEALQLYEKARRANPGNLDVYYLIGSAYHRSGDLANALEAYRKCTSGNYTSVAANHVKSLEKKLSKAK